MPRIRLDVAYDGNAYYGWAAQPGLPTVEGVLGDALATMIRRQVPLTVAGRTDAGVHARGQVVHFDLTDQEWQQLARGREITPATALNRRLTGLLRPQEGAVVVYGSQEVSPEFHARFSALSRTYTYRIADSVDLRDPLRRFDTAWVDSSLKYQARQGQQADARGKAPLDVALMDAEATSVLGLGDFGSFCKPREHSTTIRELQAFSIVREPDGAIRAELTADAFCHHMVRALIGACIEVGEGRREPGWLYRRMSEPRWDQNVRLAPPQGLVLERVEYPPEEQLAVRAAQTRALRE